MYFGAEHLMGFLMLVPSAQWYSYLGEGKSLSDVNVATQCAGGCVITPSLASTACPPLAWILIQLMRQPLLLSPTWPLQFRTPSADRTLISRHHCCPYPLLGP